MWTSLKLERWAIVGACKLNVEAVHCPCIEDLLVDYVPT